jgi:hypothetical protein
MDIRRRVCGVRVRLGCTAGLCALLLAILSTLGPGAGAAPGDLPSGGSALLGESARPAPPGTPRIEVVDPIYNFGTALSGAPLRHVFTIRNSGSAPLEITKVVTSCGCTAASPSKRILAPGEIATLEASVDTHFEQGHSLSVVTLATNDPAAPSLQLKIEGVIKPQVQAQPVDVDFGSVRRGATVERDVLVNDLVGGSGFALKSVTNASPYIKVTEAPRPDGRPGALLHVTLTPAMPPGPISDTLRIETTRAPLRVGILGVVTGDLLVKPNQVSFGILAHNQGAVRTIRLTNQGSREINVLGVKSTNDSVFARVAPVTPGKEYTVTVALRPNTPDGQIRGALTIRYSHGRSEPGDADYSVLRYYRVFSQLSET